MAVAVPFQKYRLSVAPLSPVHVGSGQTIEPYEYDLIEGSQVGMLAALNVTRLLSQLSDRQRAEYDKLLHKGDFPALRGWLRRNADPEQHRRFTLAIAPDAYSEMRRHLDNPERLGEIHLLTRNAADGRAYLPGSSLKGAIRTAIVDAWAQRHNPAEDLQRLASGAHQNRRAGRQFEATAFGNLQERSTPENPRPDLYRDPMKQLAISDITLPADASYIDRIQIVQSGGSFQNDPSGIVIYREMTRCQVLGENPAWHGEVRIAPGWSDRQKLGTGQAVPFALDAETLCRCCNDFYRPRLEEEINKFVRNEKVAQRLRNAVSAMDANQCLIRLGRHSHFECVTVGEPFHVPPRRGFGKSRSYAGGILPLGWAQLTLEPMTGSS